MKKEIDKKYEININLDYIMLIMIFVCVIFMCNSINMLASYKNLRLIGSLDFVNDDIAMKRSLLGESKDIVLSQATNISNYNSIYKSRPM